MCQTQPDQTDGRPEFQGLGGLALGVLEEGVESGVLRHDIVPSVIRDLIYGGIEHAVWRFVFSDRKIEVGALADQLADSILGGIVCPCETEATPTREMLIRLERVAERLESGVERSNTYEGIE